MSWFERFRRKDPNQTRQSGDVPANSSPQRLGPSIFSQGIYSSLPHVSDGVDEFRQQEFSRRASGYALGDRVGIYLQKKRKLTETILLTPQFMREWILANGVSFPKVTDKDKLELRITSAPAIEGMGNYTKRNIGINLKQDDGTLYVKTLMISHETNNSPEIQVLSSEIRNKRPNYPASMEEISAFSRLFEGAISSPLMQ